MTLMIPEERFRQAAEAEGGIPVSAGARVAHVRTAVEAGRHFHVDLSGVPEDERQAVVNEIRQLVDRASAQRTVNPVDTQQSSADRNG